MDNKHKKSDVWLVALTIVTLLVIIVIGGIQYLQNKDAQEKLIQLEQTTSDKFDKLTQETSQKLAELSNEIAKLKGTSPDIKFSPGDAQIWSKKDYELNCGIIINCDNYYYNQDYLQTKLEEGFKILKSPIYIFNHGKKTTKLRVELNCHNWQYFSIIYDEDILIERNNVASIIIQIPEIDQIKSSTISLLYISDEPVKCDIEYSSENIDKGNQTITLPTNRQII